MAQEGDTLAEAFLAHAGALRARLPSAAQLGPVLQELWQRARAAWPKVDLPHEAFMRHLAERLPADEGTALLEIVRNTHVADLYLACGCALGNAAAVAAFDRTFMTHINDFLARRDSLPGFSDEVKQILSERLLVADNLVAPRIAGYTGRGPLGGWLRVTATRAALKLRRSEARERRSDTNLDAIATAQPDAELAYLKSRYATDLRQALEATLAALSATEATVLRLCFLQGLTSAAIGALFGVAERTARHWVAETRRKILDETRRRLRDSLELPRDEIESLVRLLQDELGPSIVQVLDRPSK